MYVSVNQIVSEILSKTKFHIFWIFTFFAILYSDFSIFLQKHKNWKTHFLIYFVVSPKVFEQQIWTIPHFKALDQLFWPLACILTLQLIAFELWIKIPVANFCQQSLYCITSWKVMSYLFKEILYCKKGAPWFIEF